MAKLQLGGGGKPLTRNGKLVLASARCCCLCACIGETVEVTYPALTDGEAVFPNTLPCDPCDQAGRTMTLTHVARGTIGTGEEAYDYCSFELEGGFATEPDCQIYKARLYVTTNGGTWTTKTGISLSLLLLDANDEAVAAWSLELTCEEVNTQLPGAVTLVTDNVHDCDSTDATVTITGSGCCESCPYVMPTLEWYWYCNISDGPGGIPVYQWLVNGDGRVDPSVDAVDISVTFTGDLSTTVGVVDLGILTDEFGCEYRGYQVIFFADDIDPAIVPPGVYTSSATTDDGNGNVSDPHTDTSDDVCEP